MEALRRRYANVLDKTLSARTFMSEIIGVFGFVLMGTGAAALTNAPEVYPTEPDRMVKEAIIGFAFGIGILFMIYATAHNNAGQLNPAVTISLIAAGACPIAQGLLNIVGQVCGALIASGLLKALLPDAIRESSALGANAVPDEQTVGRAFLAEVIGTFIAVYVILEAVCNPRTKAGKHAPIAIGLAFGTLLTVLSPFSSGSFNPARSLGPAAVAGVSDDLWIWIFGPIVGGLLAVPFHLVSATDFGVVQQLEGPTTLPVKPTDV